MRQRIARYFARWTWLVLWTALGGLPAAQAHLLAAQKATLNIVGDTAFGVVSVPVSALRGVDDDEDGGLSGAELDAHAQSIREQVQAGVQLVGATGAAPLQLLVLDRVPPADGRVDAAASQLLVMGRFQWAPAGGDGLVLHFSLFGSRPDEQAQDWTITRQRETQWLRLVPGRDSHALLPSAWAVGLEYVEAGARHVLSGPDHLLFLLVVLSAAWSVWAVLGALSCFTLGHALTLVACVWGGVSVSERIVEPAIAATILGMAGFDAWTRYRGQAQAFASASASTSAWRFVLVFLCAVIHGLGLAGALSDVTQWEPGSPPWNMALLGFNIGIELAQLGVAAGAALLAQLIRRRAGRGAVQWLVQTGSAAAMAMGGVWLVQRLA